MPRTYGKIKVEVWESGSDYRQLSLEAQWAYQMLISQESLSMAGTMAYAPRKWAKLAAGLTVDRLEEIIGELEAAWYVIVDRETEELLIRSFIKHDSPWRTPNFLTAVRSKYRSTESEAIRSYLANRHPWLADLSQGKEQIEEYESQAYERPSERTLPLPFERTSPQGVSRARVASPEPEATPEECRAEGSGTTPRATPPHEVAALRADARSFQRAKSYVEQVGWQDPHLEDELRDRFRDLTAPEVADLLGRARELTAEKEVA